ncbi:hypothetical protein [Chachezhania antarctica]|uniref:hypothetical protein n=1 Tax=Chachezhania antarctica TaxID=2340860 RepID=UPI000EB058C5|nr:hypothetical protein [Chachezhania antarctica]
MLRVIAIVAVIGALGFGGYVYWQDRQVPPTPQEEAAVAGENLSDAVNNLKDAVTGVSSAATEQAKDALSDNVANLQASLGNLAASTLNDAADSLNGLQARLEAQGILTEDGLDYDRAVEKVNEMELPTAVRARAMETLREVQDTPEKARAYFNSLMEQVQGAAEEKE